MKKTLLGMILTFYCIAIGNVYAATVDVGWGTVYKYYSNSFGKMSATQFDLSFSDGPKDTYGFCVAPTIEIERGTNDYNFMDWTDAYLKAAWLMDQYARTKSTINTRKETVGIQSSIWAAVSDTGYAPKTRYNGLNEYNSWYGSIGTSFASADKNALKQNYKVVNIFSDDTQYQTLIVKYPSAVPVPAAVWLFGSGLLGLIGIRRRMN